MPRRRTPRPDQAVQTPPGQPYGEAKAQTEAQKAVPVPNQAGRMQQMLQAALQHPMSKMTGMSAPSERPDEPVTAGLPVGEGPGSEAMGLNAPDDTIQELRALYLQYPSEDLRELIEELDVEASL